MSASRKSEAGKKSPRKPTQRNQAVRKSAPDNTSSPWRWFGSGTLVGAVAVIALQFAGFVNVQPGSGPGNASGQTTGQEEKHTQPQPDFEFWTRLPKSEVIVPDVPEYESGERTGNSDESYILQAGSFRRLEDADRLRAELILLNLEVQIEKVKMSQGNTWHRVQTGPYSTRREVTAARNRLAKAGHDAMVLKRKAE